MNTTKPLNSSPSSTRLGLWNIWLQNISAVVNKLDYNKLNQYKQGLTNPGSAGGHLTVCAPASAEQRQPWKSALHWRDVVNEMRLREDQTMSGFLSWRLLDPCTVEDLATVVDRGKDVLRDMATPRVMDTTRKRWTELFCREFHNTCWRPELM